MSTDSLTPYRSEVDVVADTLTRLLSAGVLPKTPQAIRAACEAADIPIDRLRKAWYLAEGHIPTPPTLRSVKPPLPKHKPVLMVPRGGGRHRAITGEAVRKVRRLLDDGQNQSAVARITGLNQATVSRIVHGQYDDREGA